MTDSISLQQEDIQRAEALANSVGIPPQPRIVLDIQLEIGKPEADLSRVATLVSKDVSLSAKVLKVANSPIFGRGGTDSVLHALSLLGIKNFFLVVLQAALESALAPYKLPLDNFWRHSQDVAVISAHLAKDLKMENDWQAYMTGLFHDCGMTLMMRRFPGYVKISDKALEGLALEAFSEKFDSVIGFENDSYNTNHSLMGYVMAKSWLLPNNVNQVILHHHHAEVGGLKDPSARRLCSILQLSEFIALSLGLTPYQFSLDTLEWVSRHKDTLRETGMDEGNIKDISEEVRMLLN